MARKAYAISEDGTVALMFGSKRLRDWFIENLPPKRENHFGHDFKPCTRDEYRKNERAYMQWTESKWNARAAPDFDVVDMRIPEFWDGHWDMYDKACEAGLFEV